MITDRNPWRKVFCIFARETVAGNRIRGFLYQQECGYWEEHFRYATKKELFDLRLRGLARE